MPLLTPSRLAILIISFAFISLFWTFSLPSQLGQPALPILDHYDHKNGHADPIIPVPDTVKTHATAPRPTAHRERPAEEDDHRWDDATKKTQILKSTSTGIIKDKLRLGDTAAVKATKVTAVPTTLLTEVLPVPTSEDATNFTQDETSCRHVRGAPDVMVVLRTSKAELDNNLLIQLQGLMSCVPNFVIFSDHSGEIGGYTVYNALDSIGSEARRTHDEFREYQSMHADAEHKPDPRKTKKLDKWKWLPMVYKAYHLNPAAKWVVFIEADTSLSWTNLLQWVDRLDYRIPYHSGASAFIKGIRIGQRESGILLSQGALRRYIKSYDELYKSTWEERVGKECCGDLLLSMAMNDAHVEFYSSWPLLQGEQPNTLDYTKKHWCVPAVSWHHTNSQYLSGMWESEKDWTRTHGWNKPYLFRDAFHEHVEPYLEANKDDWDNLSREAKIVAPQGRQQQMKGEEERSKKHQEEKEQKKDDEQRKKKGKQAPNDKLAAEKQKAEASLKESLIFQQAGADDSSDKRKRQYKKKAPDWDKLAETYKDAGDSSERCMKACEQIKDCLQWRYTTKGDGECHLGKVFRLGKKTEGGDKWTSGWLLDRSKEVTKEWECKEPKWKFYQ